MAGKLHHIAVPGGVIVAEESGEGSPILLVHSATVDRRSWDGVADYLAEAGYRAIRYDIRGFGESTTADVDWVGADDLLAVMDALELGQVAVVGNSLGAVFALDAILQAPDRFVGLVWVCGGVGGFRGKATPEEEAVFAAASQASDGDDLEAIAEWNVRIWFDGIGQPPTRVASDLRDRVLAMNRPLVGKSRVFGNAQRPEPTAVTRLHELKLPITAVVGGLDANGIKEAAQLLAELGGAKLITIPGVAHLPGIEIPERIGDLILEQTRAIPAWH